MSPTFQQDEFAGIFRGRRAPRGSVYDAINGLVNDERLLFRRGGSVLKSGSDADDALLGLWDGITIAGRRTVFWSDSSLYVLDADDASIVGLESAVAVPLPSGNSVVPAPFSSGVEVGGLVFFVGGVSADAQSEVVYAGSRKTADYSTGTFAATQGSVTLTGSGTSWLANVDAGMILLTVSAETLFYNVVKSVESDTSLTLARPWTDTTGSGITYTMTPVAQFTPISATLFGNPPTAAHAVAGQRLIRALGNRAYFSRPSSDGEFYQDPAQISTQTTHPASIEDAATDYHELPKAAVISGADAIGDTAVLFTTAGVWAIENMALDAVDDFGNLQRPVRQISQDVILWGEPGMAAWAGALVVPAIDDVYVMGLDGRPVGVGDGIKPLYRQYVEAGYRPGLAAVHRGHYGLPIVDDTNSLVDVLVCRLDLRGSRGASRPAWTRWDDHAAGVGYARRVGASTRDPKLLGVNGLRVTDLTGCFEPDASGKSDGDGTNHQLQVVTQDFPSGAIEHTWTGAKVALELVDAATDNPTFEVEYSSGPVESETWTSADTRGESDGERPEAFRFAKRARALRLRITTSGAAARAVLRYVEATFRQRGRG